jgi:hypothetical protein
MRLQHIIQVTFTPSSFVAAGDEQFPSRFSAVLVIEGEQTTDGRKIAANALTWRTLPLPLTNAEDTGDDHYGAVIGKIDAIHRHGSDVVGEGEFDLGSQAGIEAARLVGQQVKRWVSIDLEIIQADMTKVDPNCDDDLEFCDYLMVVTEGRIMGAAMCAFPAFPSAVIVPSGADIPAATPDGRPESEAASSPEPIAASACLDCEDAPPASFFADPEFTEPTPMTIADDGRIYGHAALWGQCHIGSPDVCVTPPDSRSGYAYFRTGALKTSEGTEIAVGVITLATGHASMAASPREAAAHYDNTGTAVADVASGEDSFGIWFAGALRSDVTEEQVRALRAAAISGDWRRIAGTLELVAMLAVNVPGFPVTRVQIASGFQTALVAAGGTKLADPHSRRIAELEKANAQTRRMLEPLVPFAAAKLRERIANVPS